MRLQHKLDNVSLHKLDLMVLSHVNIQGGSSQLTRFHGRKENLPHMKHTSEIHVGYRKRHFNLLK